MSALGHKQTFAAQKATSALPPPESGHREFGRPVRQGPIADFSFEGDRKLGGAWETGSGEFLL